MIKTTRLKTSQAPRNITLDLTPQVNGITQTFHLPEKVRSTDTHYLLFNGQVYRNDKNHKFYKIIDNDTAITTFFDVPPGIGPDKVLQFVKTDNSEGVSGFATVEDITNAISAERVVREAAEEAIREEIDIKVNAERVAREASEAAMRGELISSIAQEAYNREVQDTILNDKIEAETARAIAKENEIQGLIGSGYTKPEINAMLADKQDTLIAGTGIQIAADGKTISATGAAIDTITNEDWSGLWL